MVTDSEYKLPLFQKRARLTLLSQVRDRLAPILKTQSFPHFRVSILRVYTKGPILHESHNMWLSVH